MDRVWLTAPAAALLIWQDAQELHAQPNPAAEAWAAERGFTAADWRAVAASQFGAAMAEAGTVAVGPQALAVPYRRVALDDGRTLLWLLPPKEGSDDAERLGATRRAAEFLGRAMGLAGVSVWRLDQRTQRIHFNVVGFKVSGMQPDPAGVPVQAMRDTIHPDDLAGVVAAAEEAAASDRVVDVVARYRNVDGSWRTLLTRRVADRDEHGVVIGLAGVSLDVTEQRAAHERAEALAERSRLVAEAIGVGFWSRDFGSGTAHWDEQLFRIHRRAPELGPPGFDDWITQYVHPADQAWIGELHQRASANWEPVVDAVFRAPDRDGGERWVQSWTRRLLRDGRRLAYGMHMDVTDRQRAQALLARERARTQFAIDAADVGIWELGLDGQASYWNAAMYRLRGLDPADPRPLDVLAEACAHPDDWIELKERMRRHLDGGGAFRCEFRVRQPGASGWRWLVAQGRALRDATGRRRGMAGINIDITERKEADALRQQKALAEQASREKSAFLARVSHELRTPMNAVLGFTHLIEDDAVEPPSARQRARLQHIAAAGAQMMALVDDLLELASLDAGPLAVPVERVALGEVALQVQDVLAGLAQLHGVALHSGALAAGCTVRADRRRLTQALTHLAGYAIRRQPRGGWVELGCHVEPGVGAVQAVLTVRDGGPDYTDSERAGLFEPFARRGEPQHAEGGGTGIGLALALRLAQALGGRIDVDNQPGAGCELRLCLPAEPEAVPGAAAAPAPAVPMPGSLPLSVLCVEDNPVNQILVRELLALRPSVRLREAVDGLSGVALALQECPDVLLLDLQLPDISGLEVLARLRATPAMAGCTYIALSANAMPDDIASALAAGFDDYWTKPIDFASFLAGIDRLAARQPQQRSAAAT
jgi:PAS domain S-box-containing protein